MIGNQHSDCDFDVNEQRMTDLAEAELLNIKRIQALDLTNPIENHAPPFDERHCEFDARRDY